MPRFDVRAAALGDQLLEPAEPDRYAAELGAEVALGLARRTDVGDEHVEHARVDHAVVHDPDRRDDQPLHVLLAVETDAPWRPAADVDVVGHRDRVRERPAVEDERRDQADVVEVQAAEMAVVAQEGVARLERRRRIARGSPGRSGPASRGGSAGRTTGRRSAPARRTGRTRSRAGS